MKSFELGNELCAKAKKTTCPHLSLNNALQTHPIHTCVRCGQCGHGPSITTSKCRSDCKLLSTKCG